MYTYIHEEVCAHVMSCMINIGLPMIGVSSQSLLNKKKKYNSLHSIMALRKLLPLGNRVLVSRIIAETQTASGIFLPEAAQKRPNEGKVVSVGPGLKDEDGKFIPLSLTEGDTVLLPEYGGTEITLGDDTFHLFRDDDILGKFE